MEIHANFHIFIFQVLVIYTYFTHIAASRTVIDDVINWVTQNTYFYYSCAYFILHFDEKVIGFDTIV